MKKHTVMSLFIMIIGFITCSTIEVVAQEQQKTSEQQVRQVKTTGVQGNLAELSGTLGEAKANVVYLEKNGKTDSWLQSRIEWATEAIQGVKDLLEKYDYPNEQQIQQQVNDLEQRLFTVVMSL